jgi:membrane-bound lytic murein transglycosylase D
VPRLIAALLIIENPDKYGLALPEPEAPAQGLARVSVSRAVALGKLDEALGLAPGVLAALNPELRASATPPRPYDLVVPANHVDAVGPAVAQLPEWKRPAPDYRSHRVQSGETLASIARRYGTSVAALQRANGLKSARLLRVGQTLRIPARGSR